MARFLLTSTWSICVGFYSAERDILQEIILPMDFHWSCRVSMTTIERTKCRILSKCRPLHRVVHPNRWVGQNSAILADFVKLNFTCYLRCWLDSINQITPKQLNVSIWIEITAESVQCQVVFASAVPFTFAHHRTGWTQHQRRHEGNPDENSFPWSKSNRRPQEEQPGICYHAQTLNLLISCCFVVVCDSRALRLNQLINVLITCN